MLELKDKTIKMLLLFSKWEASNRIETTGYTSSPVLKQQLLVQGHSATIKFPRKS